MKKLTAIILDWAGTTVDYGSFAPVDAFMTAFADFGITPTTEETRAPMGLQKRAHIAQMLGGKRIAAEWTRAHGAPATDADIDAIYNKFEPALFGVLPIHADPIPGALEAVERVREKGIAIGSTTGYTRAMMDVVEREAARRGYKPDSLVCPDECGGVGRPFPYMLWRNLEKLGVASIGEVLKIGDTAADMQEAVNAGCPCAGILKGSSMLGLSEDELAALGPDETAKRFAETRQKYREAGADYIIEDIACLPQLIDALAKGAEDDYRI